MPAQLAEAVELSSFSRLAGIEKGSDFRERSPHAERFFRVGRTDQWRDKLDEDQIRRMVSAHYRQMNRFGYLTEDLRTFLPETVTPQELGNNAYVA